MVRIAVDVMSGDNTSDVVLEVVEKAIDDFKDLEIILSGDEKQYTLDHKRIEFRHCSERIETEDEPIRAVRRKKDSSMVRMAKAVKSDEADGCISAGNTGALMSTELFIVGRTKGVAGPTLVVTLPTIDGKGFVFLDVGASTNTKPEHLLQYVQLGNTYAQKIRGVQQPKISLLNVGAKPAEGNALTKRTYQLLRGEASLRFNGNIEAKTLTEGDTDVIVTDGCTGSMVLKNIGGTTKSTGKMLKGALLANLKNKFAAAILKKDISKFTKKLDYAEYSGSVLLGLDGTVIKARGGSDARAFYSTIRQAKIAGDEQIVKIMRETVGGDNE